MVCLPAKLARARGAITLIVSLLCALLAITPARAQTFAGSIVSANGNNDTASATFSLVTGSTTYLQITLTNTSTFSNYNNADLLSGLFFSIATNPTVTTSTSSVTSPTALINSGKCASAACASPNVDLGYEWQFVYSQAGFTWPSGSQPPTTAASYGIASSQYSSLNPTFGKGVATPLGSGALDLAAKGTPQLAF
jgi:hypothetical protein